MNFRYRTYFFIRRKGETFLFVIALGFIVAISLWSLKSPAKKVEKIREIESFNFADTTFEASENIHEPDITNTLKVANFQVTQDSQPSVDLKTVNSPASASVSQKIMRTTSNAAASPKISSTHTVKKTKPVSKKRTQSTKKSLSPARSFQQQYGQLAITLANAHEYGFAYVYIDHQLWKLGDYNTTPLKIELPVGKHVVSVKRENFSCSPTDTTIYVEKATVKQVQFNLIPDKGLLP
ncbi:hypothetical protein JW960_20165 [candidate division KSB1 bacterium]|nr:hypothetical protein [candidate division KSB1 bacterium]